MKCLRCLLVAGLLLCSCHSNQTVISIPPQTSVSVLTKQDRQLAYRLKWEILAIYVKQHFKTDKSIKWIAADLALAAYYLEIENER